MTFKKSSEKYMLPLKDKNGNYLSGYLLVNKSTIDKIKKAIKK